MTADQSAWEPPARPWAPPSPTPAAPTEEAPAPVEWPPPMYVWAPPDASPEGSPEPSVPASQTGSPLAADLTWVTAEPQWDRPDPATAVGASATRRARRRGRPPVRSVPWALTCAAASALFPGLGQVLQKRWRIAALFGLPTIALAGFAMWVVGHDVATLVDWTADRNVLHSLGAGALVWALLCYASASEAAIAVWPASFSHRRSRALGTASAIVVTVAALAPGIAGAWVANRQDSLLDTVFAGSDDVQVAEPSPLGDLGITAPPVTIGATATTGAPTTQASTTVAPATSTSTATTAATTATTVPTTLARAAPPTTTAPAGRWNIALLGGDAGPHRWGLRTDTMIVVSIDRQTGDLASISVPRNLQHLPMPRGVLRSRFPSGFNDLANALYPYVATHPDLRLDPSEAIKGALAELLGIHIDNYVLVDLEGFVKIIDALGGVTVSLSSRVPLVPNIDGHTKEAPYVGPGSVRMNGKMALSFVRTREADSDYQRMKRQRCLLAAVARKTSPAQLARSYPSLVAAVEGAFRSDIPRNRLGDLVRLFAKVHVDNARTLVLVPPVITPAHPDIAHIRALVAATIAASPAAASAISKPTC